MLGRTAVANLPREINKHANKLAINRVGLTEREQIDGFIRVVVVYELGLFTARTLPSVAGV
jgi:hypothetical protein